MIHSNRVLVFPFLFLVINSFSQNKEVKDSHFENNYNKWSVEFNVGQNKAVKPFAEGYYSSDPTKYSNFSGVDHFDIGVRYMLSNKFGFKLDFASDEIKNQTGSGSLPFSTRQYRVGFQGVANLGRMLTFESFTKRFGLLVHAGVQVSQLTPEMGANKDVSEDNGGLIYGVTPQLRLNKWLALTADFTALTNIRQNFNWDGSVADKDNNLSGTLFNTTLGLTFYLGGKDKHADWFVNADRIEDLKSEDTEAREKIASLEKMLEDSDRDGVPDYRDVENNTPNGITVDAKGRFIDTNRNSVPDELEKVEYGGVANISSKIISKDESVKALVENGYVNIFYDVNKDTPNSGSTNNVYYIIQFLKKYRDTKAKLIGYADSRGDENLNKNLSMRRAQNVYDIIVASGIDSSRLSIAGEGSSNEYSADSKIGLDLARRVSVVIE